MFNPIAAQYTCFLVTYLNEVAENVGKLVEQDLTPVTFEPHSLLSLPHHRLGGPHSEQVIQGNRAKDIENKVTPENAVVAPSITVGDLPHGQVLVCRAHAAVLAVGRGVLVVHRATRHVDVFLHVIPACLTRGGIEDAELSRVTLHLATVQCSAGNATDVVREW